MRMPHRTQISDEQVSLFNQIKGDFSKEIKGHKTEITQDPCRPTTLALSEKLQQTCKYPNQDRQAATLSEVERVMLFLKYNIIFYQDDGPFEKVANEEQNTQVFSE